ncbi:CAP-Gly domain-containing linker protein 1 [Pseudocercospora fuligena]|uniref:CAP-Gly domain-containing linker protein 1 n=1 Tax=Pseudocercospora fuligena TaxID=685502 RepID=A0A8H6RMB3_9PEZI|nr:CAP-Gly domain-containing linker protein 1 [Pseudocercospora fuligena]
MALQTPRQRSGLQRPSFGNTNTASSPSLRASTTDVARKASYRALTGVPSANTTPVKMDGGDLSLGDTVNVPGEMYGTVKFLGSVRGKNGTFVGVELDREFAARGKNDGDVDGVHYFNTSIPGAGIFLPVHRAEKRNSPAVSLDSFPATPNTPSYSTNLNGHTPGGQLKFSQSVGPGAGRPSSPAFKPRRPSLPRPESPLRRQTPQLQPTPARNPLGASQRGARPSATPSKSNLKASSNSRPSTANSQPPRPYSRTGSRLGHRAEADIPEERTPVGTAKTSGVRNGSQGSTKSFSQPLRSTSRLGSYGGQDEEVLRLKAELAERDKRLAEQAANLADMEASVKELSGLLPTDGELARKSSFNDEGADAGVAQLRQMLREKNEKITILTSEFDAHRADFRSTLDSLEMASSETERVYEEQKRDLIAQVEELGARCQELEELNQSKKEFDDVANQLKQLEDFVQELEEGLEDARRGEAEARGEVEFLRGEVERGRSELKREREKAAAAATGGTSPKELEQKDDEIRGLKAIIHSFSTNPEASPGGAAKDLVELNKVKSALEESQKEKEALELELEQLRRDSAVTNGHHHTRNESEMTATQLNTTTRPRGDTIKATFAEHARRAGAISNGDGADNASPTKAADSSLYCEMCESADHDTLDCSHFQNNTSTEESEGETKSAASGHQRHPSAMPAPLSPGKSIKSLAKENEDPIAKVSIPEHPPAEAKAEDKWCALCEKDGHLAYECPDEQY